MRLSEIEMMTLTEFHYKQYAQQYKDVDEQFKLHLSAFLNQVVKSTKKVGNKEKPVYENFNDFFDYEKALQSIENEDAPKPATQEIPDWMQDIIDRKG